MGMKIAHDVSIINQLHKKMAGIPLIQCYHAPANHDAEYKF